MADRNSLLEPVPALAAVVNTTAAEVQTLLNYVARIDQPIRDSGTNLLDLLPKLERNRLGPAIHGLVEPGLTVARVVADYIVRHPDPEFNAAISQSLANRYSQVATEHPDDPEQVFFVLIRWVQSGTPETADHPRYFWAAVGIVSHYFELCDIFES